MSSHLHTYVGPYLTLDIPTRAVREDRCGHEHESANTGFCRTCGVGLSERWNEYSLPTIDPYDVWGDDLCKLDEDSPAWMPNITDMGIRIDRHADPSTQTITAKRIEREDRAFRDGFAKQIASIEKLGIPTEIHWGVVTYWY